MTLQSVLNTEVSLFGGRGVPFKMGSTVFTSLNQSRAATSVLEELSTEELPD